MIYNPAPHGCGFAIPANIHGGSETKKDHKNIPHKRKATKN